MKLRFQLSMVGAHTFLQAVAGTDRPLPQPLHVDTNRSGCKSRILQRNGTFVSFADAEATSFQLFQLAQMLHSIASLLKMPFLPASTAAMMPLQSHEWNKALS